MTRSQMEAIAIRAAKLAASYIDEEERKYHTGDPYQNYYKEYLHQLESGEDENLKWWIENQINEGVQEAVEIQRMWIDAETGDMKEGE